MIVMVREKREERNGDRDVERRETEKRRVNDKASEPVLLPGPL